ncbi:MAG: hypothetical protein H7A49_00945 [Akkermansiaceae bacterium]|nr:hypothetical protein [Akkermansiaceae bacterium]
MKAKSELILYHCLWMAEKVMHPTWRTLDESFEGWAYQAGFLRQVRTLKSKGWLETRQDPDTTERVFRLTHNGLLRAIGGVHPPEQWDRGWDGKWRMILFDLPETQRSLRNEFRKMLHSSRFGGLQGSVWISPDPLGELRDRLKDSLPACSVMTMFEGTPCGGETPADVVATTWDFTRIGEAYDLHQDHLLALRDHAAQMDGETLLHWGATERKLWADCLEADPLLPRELWPDNYHGEESWNARHEALRLAGKRAQDLLANS